MRLKFHRILRSENPRPQEYLKFKNLIIQESRRSKPQVTRQR